MISLITAIIKDGRSAVFKAAVRNQIDDGILHFGGQGKLVALACGIICIIPCKLGILRPSFIVLDGYGIAEVVKLGDQGGVVDLIGEDGLIIAVL